MCVCHWYVSVVISCFNLSRLPLMLYNIYVRLLFRNMKEVCCYRVINHLNKYKCQLRLIFEILSTTINKWYVDKYFVTKACNFGDKWFFCKLWCKKKVKLQKLTENMKVLFLVHTRFMMIIELSVTSNKAEVRDTGPMHAF